MNRHRLHLLSGGLLLALASGCDSLQETPRDFLGPENFYKTEGDAIAAVNGAYVQLLGQTSAVAGWQMWSIQEYLGPTESAHNSADQRATEQLDQYTFDANLKYINTTYSDSYIAISRINAALKSVPGVQMDETLKNRLLAEAHFLRALYYFSLVRLYGGVPLHTEPVETVEQARKPRASPDEVYAVIIDDLKFAENYLPTTYPAADYGRPTLGAAEALLGKVYLTRGVVGGSYADAPTKVASDLADAVTELRKVIQSGSYALVPDYASLFHEETEKNSEVIFPVVQIEENFFGGTVQNYITPPLTNWAGGQWGNQNVELPFYFTYAPGDKRRDVSWLAQYRDASGTLHQWDLDPAKNTHYKTAPTPAKYLIRRPLPKTQWGPLDYAILRYADVLLMLAEASNEQNKAPTAEAYDAINQVRRRAGVADLTPGMNYAQFREAVYWERLWELNQEFHTYYDAQRFWDLHVKYTRANFAQKNSLPAWSVPPELQIDDHHRLLPIPQSAIDANPELTQNPGY